MQRLKEIGDFLSKYGESIYNTIGGMWNLAWGGTTLTDNAIYVHILKPAADGKIILPPASKNVISAKYMYNNQKVSCKQTGNEIILDQITLTDSEPDVIVKIALK